MWSVLVRGLSQNVHMLFQYNYLQLPFPHHHEHFADIPVGSFNPSSAPVDICETVPSPIPLRLRVA
jgi:hypothetical protein